MEIDAIKKVKVNAKAINIHAKVRDTCSYTLLDQNNEVLKDVEDYVPSFMPGEHFGDYLDLHIDIDTGMITNWKNITAQDVQDWLATDEE